MRRRRNDIFVFCRGVEVSMIEWQFDDDEKVFSLLVASPSSLGPNWLLPPNQLFPLLSIENMFCCLNPETTRIT